MKPLPDLPMKPHGFINEDGIMYSHEGYRFEMCVKCSAEFRVANNNTEHKTCGNPKSEIGGCP